MARTDLSPSAEAFKAFILEEATTLLGRDLLSQMIYGCQATMLIGLTSGLIAILIGANIGLYGLYAAHMHPRVQVVRFRCHGAPGL